MSLKSKVERLFTQLINREGNAMKHYADTKAKLYVQEIKQLEMDNERLRVEIETVLCSAAKQRERADKAVNTMQSLQASVKKMKEQSALDHAFAKEMKAKLIKKET